MTLRIESVPVPVDPEVSPLEDFRLWLVDGWRVGDRVIAMPSGDVSNTGRSTTEHP